MRHNFIFITFLFCALLLQDHVSAQMIPWRSDYLLEWSDFEGIPDPSLSFTAFTHTQLHYHSKWDRAGNIDVAVDCSFDKTKSWKRPERNLTPKLLSHEEMHFYIAEIYARKMRQEFAAYTFSHKHNSSTNDDLNNIFQGLLKEKHEYNVRYDEETNHSKNEEKQTEWNKKLIAELKELKGYEVK